MAATKSFLDAVEGRRTIYKIENKSPISDERIAELVTFAIKHCPSPYNVQSARAVILFREQHEKLWDMADAMLKRSMPEAAYQGLAPKVQGFKNGYGSILWFEDDAALKLLQEKNPVLMNIVPECMNSPM